MDALRKELLGAMIGLARTCSNNPTTTQTEGLLLAGLHACDPMVEMTEEQLRRLTERIRQDKVLVSPNCVHCTSPCGKNADYDVVHIQEASESVRQAKKQIITQLIQLGHQGKMGQLVFDSLFALAEDWEAEAFAWYVQELSKV